MVELNNRSRIQPNDHIVGHNDEDFRTTDILALAGAYRNASDNDNMNVMNVMSNPTPANLEGLKFYAVPASWFIKAWPILTAKLGNDNSLQMAGNIPRDWKQYVGRILNAELVVNAEREVSDDDDDLDRKPTAVPTMNGHANTTNFDQVKAQISQLHRRQQQKLTPRMKPGLVCCSDYFFLGPSVWGILREKFGYDGYEICRSCCKATTSHSYAAEEGTIAIALLPGEGAFATSTYHDNGSTTASADVETIGIPPTGRFALEKILPRMLQAASERDEFPEIHDDSRNSHVVSWADDRDIGESKTGDDVIILCPSASTPINQPVSSPAFTDRMNDMDLESSTDKDSTSEDAVQVAGRKRLATGLSNLGNTCFMNSTLQCLANTEEIRKYFLSGEYKNDLNRDNPLGTGGELATQFAKLLGEMWGVSKKRRNITGNNHYSYNSYSWQNAVYPREFKTTVGRHAEQFMGYDQHDSQEFATYLLDALHEDTNRVLKKPYIEKPEQEEDEPDDVAADKAWQLHLQREDSRVLENFMGQIKSRLECCTEGCDRVSTTFDPFMYLSVPIPGSTERKIDVTFIPLDPSNKWQKLAVTVSKTGKISDLMEKTNEKLVEAGFFEKPLPLSDLCVCDIWSHDVYSWRKADADVGTISDNDKTFVYQLESLEKIREATQEMDNDSIQKWESKATHREKLDVTTITDLNANEKWLDVLLDNFSRSRGGASHQIRSRDIRVRMTFHQKLENFLNECYEVVSKEESGGLKRAREDFDDEVAMDDDNEIVESENVLRGLVERSNASESFCNVRTKRDFAILEFCANKLRQMILGEIKKPSAGYQNGVIVQVSFTKETHYNDVESITSPLVVRVPCSMTVFEFRQLLAERLSRSLKVAHSVDDIDNSPNDLEMSSGELTEEVTETSPGEPATESNEKPLQQAQAELPEPSELLVIYRAALRYDKSGGQHGHRPNVRRRSTQPLGMVLLENDSSLAKVAVASDEAEKAVMETLGDHAIVTVEWTDAYREKVFDMDEYESQERLERSVEENIRTNCKEQPITVMDCIKKYCEKEQLEESEMWYCNKCKNHVRAWKQFSLHRTPPYLIIHLKRFYFASARRRDKISEFIDFPLEGLDLTELVADYKEETKPIYDCYAVSNHIGGLGGGHYTAYIWSDEDGSWSYYNDSAVTENVDRNDVVSAEAYVLYYRRRDIPVGEDKEYCFPASPRHSSSMICEQVDSPMDQRSVASGNDTAVADEDLDATLDDAISSASSGAATAPMASEDNVAPQENSENDIDDLYAKDSRERSDFPLQ